MRALLVAAMVLGAVLTTATSARADEFTRVPALEPNVAFWKKVYIEWSINNIAFHDEQDLGSIYRVISVPARGEKDKAGRTRPDVINAAKAELESALKSLAKKNPKSADGLTGLEKEVFNNLKNVSRADKYTRLATLRAQNGLRERFLQGWANSGLYEHFIEAELTRNGLPEELIGVAFVESLFYVGAKSKVGAAGVWQFMSYTGKEYMQLNNVVDERYDPILATEAACKYLRQAKKELGTWPLAITSYNYGRGGMKGLVNGAGTKDFGTILAVSKNKRFGFAARNYYASFLAIHDILAQRDTLLKGYTRKAPWAYDVIRAPFPVYTSTLIATGEMDAAQLDVLNPALMNEARDGKIPLPHGISLRVPKGKAKKILDKLAALPDRDKNKAIRAVKTVHASNGKQTVADVAKKYGLTADVLAAATGLEKDDVPAKGQKVPIPHASARYTLLPEARSMPVPPLPAPVKILLADASEIPEADDDDDAKKLAMADKNEKLEREKAEKAEREKAKLDAQDKQARGLVTISKITVEAGELPAVDVVAGDKKAALPEVDVIAGDPGEDAPWPLLEPPPPAVAADAH